MPQIVSVSYAPASACYVSGTQVYPLANIARIQTLWVERSRDIATFREFVGAVTANASRPSLRRAADDDPEHLTGLDGDGAFHARAQAPFDVFFGSPAPAPPASERNTCVILAGTVYVAVVPPWHVYSVRPGERADCACGADCACVGVLSG